jgi:hypothetical protein
MPSCLCHSWLVRVVENLVLMTREEARQRSIYVRKRGCLYGLAVGDALGAAVEFKMPGEFSR